MELIQTIRWQDLLDILIVAIGVYWLLVWLKGTRALQMLVGLSLLLAASVLAERLGLYTVEWLVSSFWMQVVLAVLILFQPEIRRALAQIGRNPFTHRLSAVEESRTLEEITRAVVGLANKRVGAILVLEREIELREIVEMGVTLDAQVSRELLFSLFQPESPMHDGAVIIRGNRITAAGCFLPLSLNPEVSKTLGTRHRAAIGITEETDALVIVASQETGTISMIMGGRMTRELDAGGLTRMLSRFYFRQRRPLASRTALSTLSGWLKDRLPARFKT
jgi:diadenylate cyclase